MTQECSEEKVKHIILLGAMSDCILGESFVLKFLSVCSEVLPLNVTEFNSAMPLNLKSNSALVNNHLKIDYIETVSKLCLLVCVV